MKSLPHLLVAALVLGSAANAATTSYTCAFTVEASPTGIARQSSPLELRYVLDPGTRKAYLLGNAGSSEVQIVANVEGISFVEITALGNVMVTAITASGDAVHSRNGIMHKKLVPSQYYGKCVRQ